MNTLTNLLTQGTLFQSYLCTIFNVIFRKFFVKLKLHLRRWINSLWTAITYYFFVLTDFNVWPQNNTHATSQVGTNYLPHHHCALHWEIWLLIWDIFSKELISMLDVYTYYFGVTYWNSFSVILFLRRITKPEIGLNGFLNLWVEFFAYTSGCS